MNRIVQIPLMSLGVISLLAFSGCDKSETASKTIEHTHIEHNHMDGNVSDAFMADQRTALAKDMIGKDAGAQAPRDIDLKSGSNTKATIHAPAPAEMYLCDIHFHKSAEHKGGEFTTYAGNGNGEGFGSGYKYNGTLTKAELVPYAIKTEENPLYSGDTIEVHYVFSSNPHATLGKGLGTCLTGWKEKKQPLLRVEGQVYVLVNDEKALDFRTLNKVTKNAAGHYQAENIPTNTGTPVEYEGSTTGPKYNEKVSPYQVSWSVRPKVAKVNIKTVKEWFEHNEFKEEHAHGVRNIVINPKLLSKIN